MCKVVFVMHIQPLEQSIQQISIKVLLVYIWSSFVFLSYCLSLFFSLIFDLSLSLSLSLSLARYLPFFVISKLTFSSLRSLSTSAVNCLIWAATGSWNKHIHLGVRNRETKTTGMPWKPFTKQWSMWCGKPPKSTSGEDLQNRNWNEET